MKPFEKNTHEHFKKLYIQLCQKYKKHNEKSNGKRTKIQYTISIIFDIAKRKN